MCDFSAYDYGVVKEPKKKLLRLSPQVCLQRVGEFLSLQVPGLAEGRPSVLIGDAVILSSPVDPEEPQYEGIVHEVRGLGELR